jgi:transposase
LTGLNAPRAHPLVLRKALLAGRLQGSTELPGLGSMSWPLALAAADVLLGVVFAAQRHCREKLYRRIGRDLGLSEQLQIGDWEQRYGSVAILAWLLEGWPQNVHRAFTLLQAPRSKSFFHDWRDMSAELREPLHERLSCILPKRPIERIAWVPWLERLRYTAEELRTRADRERDQHRRSRLLVLAQLHDGHSIREVALSAEVWPRTVYRWLNCASRYGLEAFLERSVSVSGLTSAQEAEIAQWLEDTLDPNAPGFAVVEPEDVVAELWARFGINIPV